MPAALAIVGVVLLVMSLLIRTRTLGPNWLFGIRTFATLRSDEAWWAGHEAVAGESAVIGAGFVVAALVDLLADGSRSLGLVFMTVGVLALAHATVRADRAAREASAKASPH